MKPFLYTALAACVFYSAAPAMAQSAPASVASQRSQLPYRYVGLLSFLSGGEEYIGSGTVIKSYSVLTAGHNLYSEDTGWSEDIIFERSYDYGLYASRSTASSAFILGGYSSLVDSGRSETGKGFSRDMGGLVFFARPAKGAFSAWKQSTKLLTGSTYKMSLGYGAEDHSGEELLRAASSKPFHRVNGAFYETKYYGIEAGMSGGPVFAKSGDTWYVCAVNVSGPGGNVFNRGAGVRVIDADSATLIEKDLK